MKNRTGTYIAFDGLGKTNPAESDFRFYASIQAWSAGKDADFKYVDSHEKTASVRDSSLRETLKARIRQRLSLSKQCLVIISNDTRKTGSLLSYEIEMAVDYYKIPLIITYTGGYKRIENPSSHSAKWPDSLNSRINNGTAKAIHIPFRKKAINDAMTQFNLNNMPKGSLVYYVSSVQDNWDL